MYDQKLIKILNEVAEEVEFLSESVNGTNITKIKGLFTTVESQNKNGRTYPKPIFEREVRKIQEAISKGAVIGELEHPQRTTVDYENAVVKIDKLYFDGDKRVIGECSVIPAGKGLIIEGLIKVGAQIGISSRGTGSLNEKKIVQPDFNLITYDIVSDPSNYGSYMSAIEESKSYIIDQNGMLIEAYEQLEKDISKYTKSTKDAVLAEAIMSFIKKL